jgi:hypothetical protein
VAETSFCYSNSLFVTEVYFFDGKFTEISSVMDICFQKEIFFLGRIFLAAQSSFRSLVVGWSGC